MPVIDVDAHFEPVANWLDGFPSLKARMPDVLPDDDPRFRLDTAEMFAYFVSDDLLRGVPRDRRMPIERIVTPAMRAMFDPELSGHIGYDGAAQFPQLTDPAARVAWLDRQGIAVQNIITGAGYTLARAIKDPFLGREALEAINTWMADATAPTGGRLAPVTTLRFEDLDWAIAEMSRMRACGSRAFLFPSEPTGDIPPNHPDYDRLWAAATDLGMVPLVHVGLSPAIYHPAWANTDDPALIRIISVLQPQQQALVFLNAMVFGGVFERHPHLTVLFSEHGIDWITQATARMTQIASPGVSPLLLGRDYDLSLTPDEFVRRNVRVSPLPAAHESPVATLEQLPEVAVFSSDYPHFEGNGDPVAHYDAELAPLPASAREAFLGGNIAECYARMGDPLAA